MAASRGARINEAGVADLNVWSGRVLAASSLVDVLEGVATAAPPSKAMPPTRAQPRGARQRTRG
jgi:hypothetical protein